MKNVVHLPWSYYSLSVATFVDFRVLIMFYVKYIFIYLIRIILNHWTYSIKRKTFRISLRCNPPFNFHRKRYSSLCIRLYSTSGWNRTCVIVITTFCGISSYDLPYVEIKMTSSINLSSKTFQTGISTAIFLSGPRVVSSFRNCVGGRYYLCVEPMISEFNYRSIKISFVDLFIPHLWQWPFLGRGMLWTEFLDIGAPCCW